MLDMLFLILLQNYAYFFKSTRQNGKNDGQFGKKVLFPRFGHYFLWFRLYSEGVMPNFA